MLIVFAAVFTVIITLLGVIFGIHVKRVDKIEETQDILVSKFAVISTDLKWIKKKLK